MIQQHQMPNKNHSDPESSSTQGPDKNLMSKKHSEPWTDKNLIVKKTVNRERKEKTLKWNKGITWSIWRNQFSNPCYCQ